MNIPHPPTYADICKIPEEDRQTRHRAVAFTEDDLLTILGNQDPGEMAAAGLWSGWESEAGKRCLLRAAELAPRSERVQAALIFRLLQLQRSDIVRGTTSGEDFTQVDLDFVIKRLSTLGLQDVPPALLMRLCQLLGELAPDNGFVGLLRALISFATEPSRALAELQRNFDKSVCQDYVRHLRLDWWHAALQVGYTEFAAGLGTLVSSTYPLLIRLYRFSKDSVAGQDGATFAKPLVKFCTELQGQGQFMMDRFVFCGMLSEIDKKLPSTEASTIERQISDYRSKVKRLFEYAHTLRYADLPEGRWLEYYQTMYNDSEDTATEAVYKERHGAPGTATAKSP